ncbi:hypothetical protein FA95DRAFT_1557383 [Auriscalpium vulgare]|uniref:Uncharacterized protein n=1 Tax=Auriscalpium vulgare TaxID=40419 RepID=A0ACB8RYR3_9AGAM|nr:hypothetical protein FA95DRAFT_1557383 [Auriscalpium vulgare]
MIPFLSKLAAPRLESIHLSAVGMTSLSAASLTNYISSPRSRSLREATFNSNELTPEDIMNFIQALQAYNFSLTRCDLFANSRGTTPKEAAAWKKEQLVLKKALFRNIMHTRETERDALRLLRYARPVLLPRHAATDKDSSASTHDPPLPPELLLYTLSLLAPTLSGGQCARVLNWAADPRTLPPDPRQLPPLAKRISSRPTIGMNAAIPPHANVNGSQGDHLWEQRNTWLRAVGCDVYEPNVT